MRPDGSRKYAAIRALAVLAFVFALACGSIAIAQTAAGTVSTASGQVQIQRGGTTLAAAPGVSVSQGDRIVTGADGHVVIVLTDQSKLELSASTTITLDQYTTGGAAPTQVGLFSGLMRSVVNATGGAPANYQVHTPNAIAAVRGTRFDVAYIQGWVRPGYNGCDRYTDVASFEGEVSLASAAAPNSAATVDPGYEATAPCDQPVTPAGPLAMTGAFSSGAGNVGFTGSPPGAGGAPPPLCPVCAGGTPGHPSASCP